MRRKEREVTDLNEIARIIDKCQIIRLGMCDGGIPYVVPLNFGYTFCDGTFLFYFHCAGEGLKKDMLSANPLVCVEMDCSYELVRKEQACNWTAAYESVIARGVARELTTAAEKRAGLDAVMRQCGFEGAPVYDDRVLERTCVYEIIVETIFGKRNLPQ